MQNNTSDKISIERRCAKIKQIIRLSQCVHPESAEYFIVGINGDWVVICTDCGKVLDIG